MRALYGSTASVEKKEVRMEDGSGASRRHFRYDGPLLKPTVDDIVMRFAAKIRERPPRLLISANC
ncbi:hypothetical protein HI795_03110 [Ralstonia solanacearum]|nr:hypothetical protein HI816_03110 [Ralstonia solanacearum]QKM22176.1 hypothetical protein HI796_03105 [Ralstonia solanacearum]QKM26984.1 hypothetical protein HI795_03110 [Ralstonia solanacearum]